MSNPRKARPPYKSGEAFLEAGLCDLRLEAALDCSICREPLLFNAAMARESSSRLLAPNAPRSSHVTIRGEPSKAEHSELFDTATAMQIYEDSTPKAAFTISKSNCCPECNQELFPGRHIKLLLRLPTRETSLGFADYIEQICGDVETASEIRRRLISNWTRLLIRKTAMELWRQQGYYVEYQYVSDIGTENENEETEEGAVSDNDNNETDETNTEKSSIYDGKDTK